jgi:hypothetical protein
MIVIKRIRMVQNGRGHEHIAEVEYEQNGQTKTCTVAQVVTFLEEGGKAKVIVGRDSVDVFVVKTQPKHIRTAADGKWTDNLLALPHF